MIAYLDGVLSYKEPTYVIIDVHGVGYAVHISLQTYSTLPGGGERIKLFIHHLFREDAQILYGFAVADEKALFLDLIGVSGVGPNTALGMLSAMQPADLRLAILGENVRAVQAIKGIGAKTAQRIILELRDKMKKAGVVPDGPTYRQQPATNPVREEALAALVALGFPKPTAEKSVDDALKADPALSVEDVIRRALR
ncbi:MULTISPECIES: Holliday junction branch migration protein RuvA [Spirosoma]|uniref:Holliday junction branch migration complex subunit RuvA n=1 Tax=Spirosoma liriopis TaxID=2937440 RepID=A0ABT0HK31_9BACT|nr:MULTISPECIES: Holliday junction branch migration protein RuvA [Spirosoma]MCK8492519.1 Holliday junction branch migration protein RuvA [Spirosoma liriopis]UHG91989.1 Holliday junction branch migration protein RuvA [Spirosoma oryzicola]